MTTTASVGDRRPYASYAAMLRVVGPIYKNDGTKITSGTASSLVSTDCGTFGTGAVPVQTATSSGAWYVDLTAAQCTGSSVDVWITTDATGAVPFLFTIPILRRKALLTGTARTSGTPTTSQIQLATSAPQVDGALVNMDVLIDGGTGAGQIRRIVGYTQSTRMCDLDAALGTATSTDTTYQILPTAEASAVSGWQGEIPADRLAAGYPLVDNGKWLGGTIPAVTATGVPKVDAAYLLGTAWLTPGTAGTPDVNAKNIGGTAQTGRDIGASICRITVTTGASTTSVPTSACSPAGAVANQFVGASMVFDITTTTAALRGVRVAISASSNSATPTFTVDALPAAPVAGDTASIL